VSKTQSSADFSDYPDFLSLNAKEKPLKRAGDERRRTFLSARVVSKQNPHRWPTERNDRLHAQSGGNKGKQSNK
jgi:hypothetical protein